jgi:predicted NACHT family NTPase
MEINWNALKAEIKIETRDVLSKDPLFETDKVLDMFIKVLQHPVEDAEGKLDGLKFRIPNALNRILLDNLSRIDINTYFGDAVKIEPYLRKILFLVNEQAYFSIHDNKEGLNAILKALRLYQSPFKRELDVAYDLRNDESHQCENWSKGEIWDKLRSVLVTYLFATQKHFEALNEILNPNDLTDYLSIESKRIEFLQSRFVHIEGKETFQEIELYARELIDNDEDDDSELNAREGTIDALRKNLKERKMVLEGDVGMGKSTTLLFLHLQDSKAALKDKNHNIPVYIELKNITEREAILDKIKNKIGNNEKFSEKLLTEGRLNLFFDGLNEIEKNIKVSVFNQMTNILDRYPDNFYMFTSRPGHYKREFDNKILDRKVPVFTLQRMGDKQIVEFITKNGKGVKDYLMSEINGNDRLKRIIQTPLMLTMLIAVVLRDGKIPSEKGKIIRAFMHSLYHREQTQKVDFDPDLFHILLCYLGFQTRDLTGSNSGIDRDEFILPLLEQKKEQLGVTINLLDFLKKASDLNILVNDKNQYSFSHELYQEYYAAEFLMQLPKTTHGK